MASSRTSKRKRVDVPDEALDEQGCGKLLEFDPADLYSFKQIDDMARMVLGEGRPYSIGGFCFSMTLGERTNKQERSRFPVVTFAPMEDPIAFFEAQINRRERIEALEREPIDIRPEQQKYLEEHGSASISEAFYSSLVATSAETLLPLT